jgi:hypothetical protein
LNPVTIRLIVLSCNYILCPYYWIFVGPLREKKSCKLRASRHFTGSTECLPQLWHLPCSTICVFGERLAACSCCVTGPEDAPLADVRHILRTARAEPHWHKNSSGPWRTGTRARTPGPVDRPRLPSFKLRLAFCREASKGFLLKVLVVGKSCASNAVFRSALFVR